MPEIKKFFAFTQKDEVTELDIFDEVIGWDTWSGVFKAELDQANATADRIILNLNSPGGVVSEGLAIYSLLQNVKEKVTVRVYGVAGSIASIIALGGSRLEMADGSSLMIHDPFVSGFVPKMEAEDLRNQADTLDKMKQQLVNIYKNKTGLSCEEIEALMSKETWMFAQEAKEKGFSDHTFNEMKAVACFEGDKFYNATGYEGYKNTILEVNEKLEIDLADESTPSADPISEKTAKDLIAAISSLGEAVKASNLLQSNGVNTIVESDSDKAEETSEASSNAVPDFLDLAFLAVTTSKQEEGDI
tara:strand:- start:8016 stop:8924 length:909 start_codon:yes stop_codon:yes gene_type:complete